MGRIHQPFSDEPEHAPYLSTGGGIPGPWVELELSPKLETPGGVAGLANAARLESGGAVARLRGVNIVKALEEILAGATYLTIPVGFRPASTILFPVQMQTGSIFTVTITAAGVLTCSNTVKAGNGMRLDGITWSLT